MRGVLLVKAFFSSLYVILYHPWRVFQICVLVAGVNLVFDGSLFRFFGLHSDLRDIKNKIVQTQNDIEHIQHQKHQSTQANFIQLQAINRFNLAHKNDLVFVFSGDE